jgi:hypothetical protein
LSAVLVKRQYLLIEMPCHQSKPLLQQTRLWSVASMTHELYPVSQLPYQVIRGLANLALARQED